MSKKILTIIVPTYNMEDYLYKCLNSLVIGESDSELMLSLEVIVVNDGSTDRSSEIAHHYETKYPNTFKVIDKENGNYGSCINVGLQIATGQYIKILDADDSFDRGVFLYYLNRLKDIQVDVILSNVVEVNLQGEITSYKEPKFIEKEKMLPWQAIIPYSRALIMFSHHFTFRRQLLIDMHYHQTEGVYYSDLEWVIKPMSKIQTIYYLPVYLYKYLFGRSGQSVCLAVRRNALYSYKSVLVSLGNLWMSYSGDERRKMIIYTSFMKQINFLYKDFALLKYYTWSEFRNFDDELITNIPLVIDETNKLIIGGRLYPMPIIKLWREKHYLLFIIARLRYQLSALRRRI